MSSHSATVNLILFFFFFQTSTSNVLWSIGDINPVASEIVQHSRQARGSVTLNLLGSQQKSRLDDIRGPEMSFSITAKVRIA